MVKADSQNYTLRNICADERRQVTSSGNVIMQFPARLQIDPVRFGIGRRGRTWKPTFPAGQRTEVNNGKGDDRDDQP